MSHVSTDERRGAFATWLRTGRLPPVPREDGLELKLILGTILRTGGSPSPDRGYISAPVRPITPVPVNGRLEPRGRSRSA